MAQSLSAGTSSRRHTHSHSHGHPRADHDTGSLRHIDTEWEAKEALRQRELEEAKARAAQMEKTMRWWSDCTANWREKWAKVRNERNKAREECKTYRLKLETAMKECVNYRKEKQELELQNKHLKQELEKIHLLLLKHDNQTLLVEALVQDEAEEELSGKHSVNLQPSVDSGKPSSSKRSSLPNDKSESAIEEYVLQGAVPKHAVEAFHNNGIENEPKSFVSHMDKSPSVVVSSDDDHEALLDGAKMGSFGELGDLENESLTSDFERKCGVGASASDTASVHQTDSVKNELAMLQLQLEEAIKAAETEREEKNNLKQTVERLEASILEWNERYEDLWQEQRRTLKDYLQMESDVLRSSAELEDEYNSREGTDRRIADLRTELERLQAENAAEWGKRERLETEKLALERENKRLRAELRELGERVSERWIRPSSGSADAELRQCQQELADRNKVRSEELSNLRHAHSKLKKALQDKSTELGHAIRRAEQYDAEVKRLRGRIEELKKELAGAEDELDRSSVSARKLQRSNDELLEQVENLQLQLEFLRNSARDADLLPNTDGLRAVSASSQSPRGSPTQPNAAGRLPRELPGDDV